MKINIFLSQVVKATNYNQWTTSDKTLFIILIMESIIKLKRFREYLKFKFHEALYQVIQKRLMKIDSRLWDPYHNIADDC